MTNPLLQHQLYAAKKYMPSGKAEIFMGQEVLGFDVFENNIQFAWLIKAVMCHKNVMGKDSDLEINIDGGYYLIQYHPYETILVIDNEQDLTTFCLKALPILDGIDIDDC